MCTLTQRQVHQKEGQALPQQLVGRKAYGNVLEISDNITKTHTRIYITHIEELSERGVRNVWRKCLYKANIGDRIV